MDTGIGARGICVSLQGNNEAGGVWQQNQKFIVVAGEFFMNTGDQ